MTPENPHRRKSDLSKPAKISDFLRTWGGFVYPLFTLVIAAGFVIATPAQQFDGIKKDIVDIKKDNENSKAERLVITRKLDIIIAIACVYVPTRDVQISQLQEICPIQIRRDK